MKNMHPAIAVAQSRLLEFIRRPEAVFWVYFFPVLMVIVLGIAFRNKPVESFDVDIVEGPLAQEIFEMLKENENLVPKIVSQEESESRIREGKSTLAIRPRRSLKEIEYTFDRARPGSFNARDIADRQLQTKLGRIDVIQSKDIQVGGATYVDFLVPGLLGMGLMGGGLWGVGFAIVDMRIRKLLKRFMATPMKRSHFLMGMMISRLIFMIPQIIVLLLFSYLVFNVQIRGSWLSILLIVVIGAVEFAAIGLLVASRARTLETASGLMNLVMLPMWTLSGIFFSYERFPEVVQPLIRSLPLTPVIDALRKLMMQNRPLSELGFEITVMLVWTVVTFTLALAIFRWND